MIVPYSIYWSPIAEKSYLKTIEYILEKWSIKEAEAFEKKVERLLFNISYHRNLCPPSFEHRKLRRCVITPQTSLVYTISGKKIEIIIFFDNRSNHSF